MTNFLLGFLSLIVALLFSFAVGDIGTRMYYAYAAHNKKQKLFSIITLDDELGWRPTPNYAFSGDLRDASGQQYPADLSTDVEGFPIFGKPEEGDRRKVLLLGDSFTQAMHVSDDKT